MQALPRRSPSAPTRSASSSRGLACAFVVLLGCAAAAFAGLGSLVQLGFPAVGVLVAAILLRRKDGAYLEYVLWLWLLTPELRRVVDAGIGWHPTSIIMVVPPVASVLGLLPALFRSRRLNRGAPALLGVALLSVSYGGVVGALLVGPAPAAAGALNWLPPVAMGLYVANAGPSRDQVRQVLLRTALLGAIVLGGYGLLQFLVLPPWDRFWIANAQLSSLGRPEPQQVRVFSVLNSPGPFATSLGALLTLLIGARVRWRSLAFTLGFASFGLSLVRGAWLAFALASLLLLARRKGRGSAQLVALLLVPVALAFTVGGPVTKAVTDRFSATSSAGGKDQSLSSRVQLYQRETGAVFQEPFGQGVGSLGTATKVGNGGRLTATGTLDSGLLEYPYTFGIVVGSVFLGTLLAGAVAAYRRTRRSDEFGAACAAAVMGLILQLLFGSVTTSVTGVLLWVLLGLLLRAKEEIAVLDPVPGVEPSSSPSPS